MLPKNVAQLIDSVSREDWIAVESHAWNAFSKRVEFDGNRHVFNSGLTEPFRDFVGTRRPGSPEFVAWQYGRFIGLAMMFERLLQSGNEQYKLPIGFHFQDCLPRVERRHG